MAESNHPVELALVYDRRLHVARWLFPATAWTVCRADPRIEIIEESNPHFDAYAQLAGIKPKVYISDA